MAAFESTRIEIAGENTLPAHRVTEFTVHSNDGGSEKPFDIWLKRLMTFKDVQVKYHRLKRIKNTLGLVGSVSVAALLFAMFSQFSIPETQLWLYLSLISLSLLIYPISFLKTLAYSKQKLVLSRFFYSSNHEVDTKNGSLYLIDRGSNKIVAEIPI